MALLALLTECSPVRLIRTMAVNTFRSQLLVFHDSCVADVAVEIRVSAFQREFEALQMVEIRDAPDVIVMAIRARGPEATGVLVIRLVTSDAILRYRVLQVPAAMTIATTDLSVAAEQGESCLTRVIELLRTPTSRRMTVGALGTLTAFVHVVR